MCPYYYIRTLTFYLLLLPIENKKLLRNFTMVTVSVVKYAGPLLLNRDGTMFPMLWNRIVSLDVNQIRVVL